MKINTAKQKMLRGEPAFGWSLGSGSPVVAEVLAHSGIDFVMIDNQHGSWGPDSTIAALMAINAGSATPMARVARNDYTMIGRLLDEGMLGIVVPMVHTREDAQAAADAVRFPPHGQRSWGWGRAARYGPDYGEAVDEQIFLAVQIESAQAVENAEAILSVPGVDGCWMGPSDLSFSLGLHPRVAQTDERVLRAVDRVLEACNNTGKIAGFASFSTEDARQRADRGFRFLTAGGDVGFLLSGARNALQILRG
jgi:4-hydroxy-2-oxoheptanedioate aldolase